MEETKNELQVMEGGLMKSDETLLTSKNSRRYCTMDLTKDENKITLYNSLQQCDVLLNDIKGQVIEMKDVFIEEKEVPVRDEKTDEVVYNEETGEVETKIHFRTIIYATDGQTYVSSAYGIYNSLKQIIPVFGNPSEENIIKVKVGEKTTRNGRKSLILTVEK